MNGYLLDTHVLLWWLCGSPRLAREVQDTIHDPRNRIYVSVAAVWEMVIKRSLGRLDFPTGLREMLGDNDISLLDINIQHVLQIADLPIIHRDPFDRVQIAQAQVESLVLVTRDLRILEYDAPTLRA